MQKGTSIMSQRIMASAVGDLVREASSLTAVLQITHNDVGNEASRISAERREVSPESSGTLKASTTIDKSPNTPGGNVLQASFGLHLLARAAAEPHPLPFIGAAVKPTNPTVNQNCCLYPNCCVILVPSICCTMSCTGKVHQYCSFLPMYDHRWSPFPNEPRSSHIPQ